MEKGNPLTILTKNRRGAELSERKNDTYLKQDNAESVHQPGSQDCRIQHVVHQSIHQNRPCTHLTYIQPNPCRPLKKVSQAPPPHVSCPAFSLTTTTPVLQPYNAGRNGIGWVPGRAGVECIAFFRLLRSKRAGGDNLSPGSCLCDVWCTRDDYSRLALSHGRSPKDKRHGCLCKGPPIEAKSEKAAACKS